MIRKSCWVTVADEHATVLAVIEDLEGYNLSKALAQADLCADIQAAIERRVAERKRERTP